MTWHKLYIKISKSQIHNVPRPSKALSYCLEMSFHLSSSPIFHIREIQSEGRWADSSWWKMKVRTTFLTGSLVCSKTSCTIPSVWNSIPVPFSVVFYIPRHIFLWGKKKKSKPLSVEGKKTSGKLCMAMQCAVRWHCSICRKNYWHYLQFHILNVIFWHNLKTAIFVSP
jgi:hypothetical protein